VRSRSFPPVTRTLPSSSRIVRCTSRLRSERDPLIFFTPPQILALLPPPVLSFHPPHITVITFPGRLKLRRQKISFDRPMFKTLLTTPILRVIPLNSLTSLYSSVVCSSPVQIDLIPFPPPPPAEIRALDFFGPGRPLYPLFYPPVKGCQTAVFGFYSLAPALLFICVSGQRSMLLTLFFFESHARPKNRFTFWLWA